MAAAERAIQCRGVDPAAPFRGHYSTRLGLARLIKGRGGMIAHFDRALAAVGIERTDAPVAGDIAVVDAPEGTTGAVLMSNGLCASVAEHGLRFRKLPILAAWRV